MSGRNKSVADKERVRELKERIYELRAQSGVVQDISRLRENLKQQADAMAEVEKLGVSLFDQGPSKDPPGR